VLGFTSAARGFAPEAEGHERQVGSGADPRPRPPKRLDPPVVTAFVRLYGGYCNPRRGNPCDTTEESSF
jgi:hypothetical protein